MDLGLADARVLVVGGSRGMGRAAAETFAREGARVAVLARASGALDDSFVVALHSGGSRRRHRGRRRTLTSVAEVDGRNRTVPASCRDAPEVLVNAGGTGRGRNRCASRASGRRRIGGPPSTSRRPWRAPSATVRRALPLLQVEARSARIVNVSAHSTRRQSSGPGGVQRRPRQGTLTSLTKNLSQALAPDGILVNTVSPGLVPLGGNAGVPPPPPPRSGESTATA